MTNSEFKKMMNEETGIIQADSEGNSTCSACGGAGTAYEESVVHLDGCRFKQAVELIVGDMPTNFIPGVENQLTIHTMLHYMAELDNTDLEMLDRLTTELLRLDTYKERYALIFQIGDWCGTARPELLNAVALDGLKDNKERVTLFNYLVFEKASAKKLRNLNKEITSALNDREATEAIFCSVFDKKYKLGPSDCYIGTL